MNSALFVKALRDKNPRARLQAVIGLARLGNPHKSLLNIAAEPVDNSPKNRVYSNNKIIPHIARKALVETGAAQICLDGISNEQTRQAALAALQEMHNAKAVDGLIQQLQETTNSPLNTGILAALSRLYHVDKRWNGKRWWSTRPDDRGPYFEPVEWEASPRIGAAIKTGFAQLNAEHKPQMIAKMKLNRIDPAALGIDTRTDEALAFIASASLGTIAIEPLRKAALDVSATRRFAPSRSMRLAGSPATRHSTRSWPSSANGKSTVPIRKVSLQLCGSSFTNRAILAVRRCCAMLRANKKAQPRSSRTGSHCNLSSRRWPTITFVG